MGFSMFTRSIAKVRSTLRSGLMSAEGQKAYGISKNLAYAPKLGIIGAGVGSIGGAYAGGPVSAETLLS